MFFFYAEELQNDEYTTTEVTVTQRLKYNLLYALYNSSK